MRLCFQDVPQDLAFDIATLIGTLLSGTKSLFLPPLLIMTAIHANFELVFSSRMFEQTMFCFLVPLSPNSHLCHCKSKESISIAGNGYFIHVFNFERKCEVNH